MRINKLIPEVILLISSTFILSCNSEFEPHIFSESTPVVYGVINPQDSLYQIKLTKSFIGPGNAYNYAQIPDSIYYDDARVFLESRNFRGIVIDNVELFPIEIEPRKPGIFAQTPNIVYQTDFKSIRLRPEILAQDGITFEVDLFLLVQLPDQPELIESRTRLKPEPKIINPRAFFQKVYFYGEVPFFMEWTHTSPDTYFEIKVVIHYREILETGERETEAHWILTGIQLNEHSFPGGVKTFYTYYFRPENFYSQIRAAIPIDPEVKGRAIISVDFIILTSDGAIKDYNEIGRVADDYHGTSYTNILNGLGLFSSYNTKGVFGQRLGQRELDSLALGTYTRHLNFSRW